MLGWAPKDLSRPAWLPQAIAALLVVLILLADRWVSMEAFAFRFVDDDQAIMWHGAKEMTHGRFHEPCFYGQRYGVMLESLLAVPLLKAGVAFEQAMPIATSFLALSPLLLLAALLYRSGRAGAGGIMLLVMASLPVEHGLLTSIPRGFVSGAFLAAFGVLPLFSLRPGVVALAGFASVLAMFANPNSAIALLPAWLLMAVERGGALRFWGFALGGVAPGAVLYWAGKRFYHVRPAYEVHRSWPLDFEWGRTSWNAVNGYLADVAPLLGLGGWVALAAIGALGAWYAMRRQWKPALASLCALVMLVLVFGVNKVHDGLPTVFYSWSRMFLAYPLLLGVLLARFAWAPRRYWAVLLPVGALAFIALKWRELPDAVARETAVGANTNVHVASIGELRGHCGALRAVASEQLAGLVVLGWHPLKHLTAYACPCLEPGFPETVEPALDRRAWKLVELGPRVEPTVLFACFWPEDFAWRMRENSAIRVASEAPLTFVLGGNADRTDTLLARLRMPLRPH